MLYPLPYNITGFVSLAQYVNVITNALFGDMILLALGIVLFLAMKGFDDFKTSFSTTAIILVFIAVMFWEIQLISLFALIVCIGLSLVGILIKIANLDWVG
jgi:hypothetical protein